MCHRIVPITLEEAQDLAGQMARGGRAFARPDGQGRWGEAPADAYPDSPVPVIVPAQRLAFAEGDGLDKEAARAERRERMAERSGLKAALLSWGMWGRPASSRAPGCGAPVPLARQTPGDKPMDGEGARPQSAKLVFNTRLDTALRQLSEGRGMWAEAMASGRCLVPVRAFFEGGGGRGARFTVPGAGAFLLAGVAQDGRFSVVTTGANAAVAPVHGRMPLVLGRGESAVWLEGEPGQLARLGDRSSIRLAGGSPHESR